MNYKNYDKTNINATSWVITDKAHDYLHPQRTYTFAFDTETQVYYKGVRYQPKQLFKKIKNLNNEQKRKLIHNVTWAWQVYDEYNGFFMTNSFDELLQYICRCRFKFGWCYNSTFDFAQIDYQILAEEKDKWTPHKHKNRSTGEAYNKGQPWTYESLHNDMGARYAYKLWVEYKNENRHLYTHSFEFRDFMKLITGGLDHLLKDLDIKDEKGEEVRKLKMDYNALDPDNLTEAQIDYCMVDVKGLYFAIKKFNETIEERSGGECHIFGKETNIMTAGGFAKRELLHSLYPTINGNSNRLKKFQRQHPITLNQDKFFRENGLYRGGISYVNPYYKGQLLYNHKLGVMYRYDVNSEYPYAMSEINDLIGEPFKMPFEEYMNKSEEYKSKYECIYMISSISGIVKENYIGLWYDTHRNEYVDIINETGTHLIFEKEFQELLNWYDDVETQIEYVILCRKGEKVYRPFVLKNYELKAQAKKDHNKTLQATAKLLLNSSYGKLAERLCRIKGHYEECMETGAIHFVKDEEEIDEKARMSVLVGSLITSYARTFIMSKIREVCGEDIKHRFIYIDTDSIHAFAKYDKADPYTLGGLKLEATCQAVKYIAPKTYFDIEEVHKDGTIEFNKFEIHSKGVNIRAIIDELHKKQKYKKHNLPTIKLFDTKFNYGQKYVCLTAMNVKGGKVLLPTEKYLARLELSPNYDEQIAFSNYNGSMFIER